MDKKIKNTILEKIIEAKKERLKEAEIKRPESLLKELFLERKEPSSLKEGLHRDPYKKTAIIAEIKRNSPSKGELKLHLDIAFLADAYKKGGAAAISILTEEDFFKGSLEDLRELKKYTELPVLRKDFIFSSYQVLESAAMGADAILLIARILEAEQHKELSLLAEELNLEVLHEVHGKEEVEQCLACNPSLIGINNRNLEDFKTDINHAPKIASLLPEGTIPIALSGIRDSKDIALSRSKGVHSFLIGESLVKSRNPEKDLREMIEKA